MTSSVWGAISANTLFQIPDYDDPAISGSIIRTEIRPSAEGVDKTWNTEHSGTCRNIPEHSRTSRNMKK